MNQLTYTKIFLNSANYSINDANVTEYRYKWWVNNSSTSVPSLRLTRDGRDFLKDKLEVELHRIKIAKDTNIHAANVILYLDKFIKCPFYLGATYIEVTDERVAIELSLFSGDLNKYGLTHAIARQKNL